MQHKHLVIYAHSEQRKQLLLALHLDIHLYGSDRVGYGFPPVTGAGNNGSYPWYRYLGRPAGLIQSCRRNEYSRHENVEAGLAMSVVECS